MRNVIMQLELTLDGFATGPNGEMDWFTLDHQAWEHRVDHYNTIDTVPTWIGMFDCLWSWYARNF